MTAASFPAQLPWSRVPQDDTRFYRTLALVLLLTFGLALWLGQQPVAERMRPSQAPLPPPLVRMSLPEEMPTPVPAPEPTPEPAPEPAPQEPDPPALTAEEAAKQQATASMRALQDTLAGMRERMASLPTAPAELRDIPPSTPSLNAPQTLAHATVTAPTAQTLSLAPSVPTAVDAPIAGTVQLAKKRDAQDAAVLGDRDLAAIRATLEAHQGALYTLYRVALRQNPDLQGRFSVRLRIDPSGQLASLDLISSELDDPSLERKLLTRIKMIDFGAAQVLLTELTYTFHFLPY